MATGRVPTTANSPLTTKGDLFGYSTAPARLAVGSDGETIVADSSTATGLRWQGSMAGGKNAVINGGMDIWQRGTSFANPNVVYTADRWQAGTHSAATLSRQASDLAGFQYFARYQRNSGSSVTTAMTFANSIETSNSLPFAGKTATLSFYARAGANYSASGNNLNYTIASGTGTDQNVFGTYTGFVALAGTSAVLTTSWQRFSTTVNVGSSATELAFYFTESPTGTAGAADYFDITGVQLELGSVATTFSRAGGTIQGELAACQRYYYAHVSGAPKFICMGAAYTSSEVWGGLGFPVTMRTVPSLVATTGTNYYIFRSNGTYDYVNSLSLGSPTTTTSAMLNNTTEVSQTANWAGWFATENASASIAFSAEL